MGESCVDLASISQNQLAFLQSEECFAKALKILIKWSNDQADWLFKSCHIMRWQLHFNFIQQKSPTSVSGEMNA
ncbi:hypothetical protein D7X33_49765 [Butyricicoccus sp. 1XD8-22]|nr:hypothetical protein D7X33_49765 [Butyricicoccus sp. 1XD8-22]